MAVKHKKAVKATKGKTKALTPKQQTAMSATKFGVPFYLLWGIAGAESTWGQGGTNLFGLLDAAEGANVSNWKSASEQAAKTLKGLKKQYGSWSGAVEHYSGYSYNLSHPKQLAGESGVTPANESRVIKRSLSGVTGTTENAGLFGLPYLGEGDLGIPGFGELFGGGGEGLPGHEGALEGKGPLGGVSIIPASISTAFQDFDAVAKLLVSPQFWIRVAEGIGGIILLYMALKALTGASVPGEGVAKSAAKAAAFKRLPPRQRVT